MPADTALLVDAFITGHPLDAAEALEDLPPAEAASYLFSQPLSSQLAVVARMRPEAVGLLTTHAPVETAKVLLEAMNPNLVARMLGTLDEDEDQRLLGLVNESVQKEVRAIRSYPSGVAGSLMDTRFRSFPPDDTVEATLNILRISRGGISDLMVTGRDGGLKGAVPLQSLLSAAPDQPLRTLLKADVPSVQPMSSREEIVELLDQYRLTTLPVTDVDGKLLGVLRYDALVDAAQAQATAGIQRMVGAHEGERALSSPWQAIRSRLPWLHINLLTAFLAAAVVGLFENTIAQITAVAVLLPVVAGQSGNTGAQAMAVTMRGLALREIRTGHWVSVLRKEAVVGTVNGLAIAVVTSVGVLFWSGKPALAMVMFVSMIVAMIMASVSGAAIPIILQALGRDPAAASSIVLTTITDVTGFFAFLGLATLMTAALVS